MTPTYWVTTSVTTTYSLKIEADSETHAEEIAEMTDLDEWHEDSPPIQSNFYDIEEMIESEITNEPT